MAASSVSGSVNVWRESFAALYARHMSCSLADAAYIARMLQPVLGQLPPWQALDTVTTDAAFLDEMEAHRRREQG